MNLQIDGHFSPELSAFDNIMRTFVQQSGAPALSLAIARNGKLLFAESVSNSAVGNPPDPPLLQTSPARFASCSKLITKIAIYQLVEKGLLSFNDSAAAILANHLPEPASQPIVSKNWSTVRVIDLILMTCTIYPDDPPPAISDQAIVAEFGHALPVASVFERLRYVIGLPDYIAPPGSTSPYTYSNAAYLALTAIVSAVAGSYSEYVRKNIFAPLGLTRPAVAGSLLSQRAPNEAFYHPQDPAPDQPNYMGTGPSQVQDGEGNYNFNILCGYGGWLMCTADFAKILSSFAVPPPGPLFKTSEFVKSMFTPGPYQWATESWAPSSTQVFDWGGTLPGLRSYAGYRADGVVLCAFMNTDEGLITYQGQNSWHPLLGLIQQTIDQLNDWPSDDYDLFPSVGIPPLEKKIGSLGQSIGGITSQQGIGGAKSGTGLTDKDFLQPGSQKKTEP